MQETKETSSDITTNIQEERTCDSSESSTCGALLFEKVFCGRINKIGASECHNVPVLYCICIENVSSHTVLTR